MQQTLQQKTKQRTSNSSNNPGDPKQSHYAYRGTTKKAREAIWKHRESLAELVQR
jgi:hypothetical protein